LASNTTLNSGTGGDVITTKERTHDGDATKQQVVSFAFATGSEGSYTHTDAVAGAGAVSAGVQRVTLASDDPAVVALQILDNAISGSEMQVDVVGALPAGANTIGAVNIAAAQTLATVTTVGTVTSVTNVATIGTSVTPGTSAAHLGKAEDAAHGSGDTGVMLLAVRRDADTTLVDTTNDYAPLQVNSAGSLKVAITAGAGSGGTSIADGASFTRDTTSITPIGCVVEASAPTLTNGDVSGPSMTTGGAIRVSVASGSIAGIVDDAAFTPGTSEVLPVGFTFDNSSPDSVDEGDIGAARMSANRNIFVNIRDNAGNERGLNIDASGQLAANVAQINGVTVLMGNGASGTGAQRVTLANDSTGVLATVSTVTTVTNITNQGHGADDAAFTPATTRVMVSGYFADETATDSVDEGDMGAARITLDRKQITTPYVHAAAGGQSSFKSLDLDESEEEVKGSAGKLFWIHCMNMTASLRYLKIYANTAAGTTVGTTTPIHTFPIPTLATTNGAGFCMNFGDTGISIATGICVAVTTGLADNDTGAPGAGDVVFNCGYA
jgi:hypothetical protein